ncbi:host specificity protein J [Escherichia coli]|nr:host specificity protein J [Escherichia coli]
METQTVDFTLGSQGLRHTPGDIIEICDNDYAGTLTGGRVLSIDAATRTLTLDREVTLPGTGAATVNLINGSGKPVSVDITAHPAPDRIQVSTLPDGVETYGVWGLSLPSLRRRLFRCVAIRENTDGTFAITAVQHVPEKEAIVDNGARFEPQSGTLNSVIPPAVQHLTVEVSAADSQYLALAKWDTPRVVKGVRFSLRLTSGSGENSRLLTTVITADTEHCFSGLPPGEYTLTVRAINSYGQQGEPATTTFRINAPAAPATIELTPGYFQITAVPRLAVYDPTVQFEFWFSEAKIADAAQVETSARYLGTGSQWSVSGPHIKPGKDFWFYVRSVNLVGKSAFVEASGRASNDAAGYLELFREKIGKTHLAEALWAEIDNSQLKDEMAEMQTTITETRNEITQTVSKTLEDQSATIQQIQRVQKDTNDDLAALYMLKVQKTKNGIPYVSGIGAGIEDADGQPLSNILLLADRISMINPEDGNTTPLFVAQGNQLFMNDVFLKRLFAVSITSSGNPPTFSLTPEGRLTARNADISGNVNANSGTLNNVTINENCRVLGKLSANQIEGDLVKTVGKAFPRDSRAPERWPSGTITVRVYDDQPFDRQIVIPAVAFSGAKHEREHTDIYSSCRLIVRKNGAEIYNRTALDNTLIYSGVIDMPAGHGHMTLEFSVSAWLVNNWYPTASISDLLVVVMKKATAGITIS